MPKISAAKGVIINDSRGEKTIEVAILSGDIETKASVPSGKSRGKHEAKPAEPEKALQNLDKIMRAAALKDFRNIREFDDFLLELDGTPDKRNLGANTTLALSVCFARLLAKEKNIPLYEILNNESASASSFPRLFANLINGGLHVDHDLNPLPFQEYLVIPQAHDPDESLRSVFSFIESLKSILVSRGAGERFGDEGGFVVSGVNPELGLEILDETRRIHDGNVDFGIDAAASSLYSGKDGIYKWRESGWNNEELARIYKWIAKRYGLLSIEDPFDEDKEEEWIGFMRDLRDKEESDLWVVGDDLTVTNAERIKNAAEANAANAVIIKPNQRGTVSETIRAADLAKQFGWKVIVSHRSGETEDDFIADLAYGIGADGLKAGSPLRGERLVKYKRLIEIKKSLENKEQ